MPLSPGARLGPYEIIAPLGAGGMGEVFKARDTRLDRSVAIKILPASIAANPQFRLRFEREAKTISQLNHPNICTLHDVGRDNGTDYLVMELIEGESLANRLLRGPLPLSDTLNLGAQIAVALDRAHRAGIVHRDLKPGNIMLTKSSVKLLDFGLARTQAAEVEPSPEEATAYHPLTERGTILGTFQYMAPEQIEGAEADPRADIFALGAVLYEMITGKRAFNGKTRTSVIAAIVGSEPEPASHVQPLTPKYLDHVIATCLAKEPDDRWQSAADIAHELKWLAHVRPESEPSSKRSVARLAAGALVLAIAVSAATAAYLRWHGTMGTSDARVIRAALDLPAGVSLANYGSHSLAISPDGRYVAFAGEQDAETYLYVRPVDKLVANRIDGTAGASQPFFSPDSKWIAFAADNKLQKVLVAGGPVQTICDAIDVRGASWGPRGQIVFAWGSEGLRIVSADGGQSRVLTKALPGESSYLAPQFLPDGQAVVFGVLHEVTRIEAVGVASGERTILTENAVEPKYLASGHLVFLRGATLIAAPFDANTLKITGPAVPILDGVMSVPPVRRGLYALSDDGTLVYAPGGIEWTTQRLQWVDRAGKAEPLPLSPNAYEEPRLSPDNRRVVMTLRAPLVELVDVWMHEFSRGTLSRLTFGRGEDETPIWTADGGGVTFSSGRIHEPRTINEVAADGSGTERRLLASNRHPHASSWSPDGRFLAYTDYGATTFGDIWIFDRKGGGTRAFLQTPFNERAPRFSPDGKWLAYVSNESGRDEIYVEAFPGPGGKAQISSDGGSEPVWSPRGGELFYRAGKKMMSVDVRMAPAFTAGTPRTLFEGNYSASRRGEASYDVAVDGKRFLMVSRAESSGVRQVNLVTRWIDEVRNRVASASSP